MTNEQKARIIIREVCQYLGADEQEIRSKCRKREIVEPRQFAMYFIKKHTNMSLQAIGAIFGKDHATVINACRTVENLVGWNGYAKKEMRMRMNIASAIEENEFAWCDKIPQL